jgi:hypothetical protein
MPMFRHGMLELPTALPFGRRNPLGSLRNLAALADLGSSLHAACRRRVSSVSQGSALNICNFLQAANHSHLPSPRGGGECMQKVTATRTDWLFIISLACSLLAVGISIYVLFGNA